MEQARKRQKRKRINPIFIRGNVSTEALSKAGEPVGKSIGETISKQFKEGLFGIGPKDEGNYNAVINVLLADGYEEEVAEIDRWLESLPPSDQNWFRRVISNMVTDAVTFAEKDEESVDFKTVVASIVLTLKNLSQIADLNKRTEAARARGLLKRHYIQEELNSIKKVWKDATKGKKDKSNPKNNKSKIDFFDDDTKGDDKDDNEDNKDPQWLKDLEGFAEKLKERRP